MRDGQSKVPVERLSNLDDWEFYRLVHEDTFRVLCTISVKPHLDVGAVEYGLWREGEEEPSVTGSVESEAAGEAWSGEAREAALRSIVYRHEKDLGVSQEALEFDLCHEPDAADDEDPEEEEEEESEQDA